LRPLAARSAPHVPSNKVGGVDHVFLIAGADILGNANATAAKLGATGSLSPDGRAAAVRLARRLLEA